jgi:hypothetical protein
MFLLERWLPRRNRWQWLSGGLVFALAILLDLRVCHTIAAAQSHRLWLDLRQGFGFRDPVCSTGYCDYPMFWLAGTIIRHAGPDILYDHARYLKFAYATLPYKSGFWPFIYPPTVLLVAAPLSFLPLVGGYYLSAAAAALLCVLLLRRAGIAWWRIALGILSPLAMWNLYLGQQIGLLCGVLLFAGLAAMRDQPVRSGLMLGLLCLKPQFALLVPVAVLASRSWRTLCAGALLLALLLLLSLRCGGVAAWLAYSGAGRAAATTLLDQHIQPTGITVFWMLRSLSMPLTPAYACQALASCGAACACWHLWSRPVADRQGRAAITVFLSFLATPYGLNGDLAIFSILLVVLLRPRSPWRNAALAWLGLLPIYMPRVTHAVGILPTAVLILTAVLLVWRMRAPDQEQSGNLACAPA